MKNKDVSSITMMGDSLTDRGTFYHRLLFGFIPIHIMTGMQKISPLGRFTNGLAWSDHISATLANRFIINDLTTVRELTPTEQIINKYGIDLIKTPHPYDEIDIAEAIINKDQKTRSSIDSYGLDNPSGVTYKGQNLVKNYNEGGLTSHNYAGTMTLNLSLFFKRLILATLDGMRKKLLEDNKTGNVSPQTKAETLLIEWSGGNDLITANEQPTEEAVEKALTARINNLKQLIKEGYQHFILFNLPDLSLTPLYQSKSAADIKNAYDCVNQFNTKLQKACEDLAVTYPHCSIEMFDANNIFTHVYNNPEKYGFDKEKRKTPYTKSPDFDITKEDTSPAKGYMFWDDIHPSADMHAILARFFFSRCLHQYNFLNPNKMQAKNNKVTEAQLLQAFRKVYSEKLAKEKRGFFGHAASTELNYHEAKLDEILELALYKNNKRIQSVVQELQWLDEQGQIKINVPLLHKIKSRLDLGSQCKENPTHSIALESH